MTIRALGYPTRENIGMFSTRDLYQIPLFMESSWTLLVAVILLVIIDIFDKSIKHVETSLLLVQKNALFLYLNVVCGRKLFSYRVQVGIAIQC